MNDILYPPSEIPKVLADVFLNKHRIFMPLIKKSEDLDIEYILQHSSNKFFEEYAPKKIHSKMYEVIKTSADRLTIKLIDKHQRDLLSIVHGNIKTYKNIDYYEIAGTYSKHGRRGFLTYLFELLVYEFDYKILSDSQHSSPGSKEFWQALIRRNRFSIYRLNLETNFKRNANRFKDTEIWREAASGSLNSFFNNLDYPIEDDIEVSDDFENLDNNLEEIDEILNVNNLLNAELKHENSSFDKIRLVAQKYVD